jgi:hypothetical protein
MERKRTWAFHTRAFRAPHPPPFRAYSLRRTAPAVPVVWGGWVGGEVAAKKGTSYLLPKHTTHRARCGEEEAGCRIVVERQARPQMEHGRRAAFRPISGSVLIGPKLHLHASTSNVHNLAQGYRKAKSNPFDLALYGSQFVLGPPPF